jgi:hypothetical protein
MPAIKLRLFLTCWIVFTFHFATDTVREHYPAFSLIEAGTFKVDRYQHFHPDIFVHDDGHAYIGNNVMGSVVAAIPLLVFRPVLDRLEAWEQDRILNYGTPTAEYRNERHPNSQAFFRLAKESGLTLRFGAATAVTSAFLMAPLSALIVVLMFQILFDRGVSQKRALGLALLFGFGTPVFFRTGVLNHNMMLMYTTFVAFHLLWVRPGRQPPASLNHRMAAGFLVGVGLALDYSGVVPLLVLFGYLIGSRALTTSLPTAIRESIPFVLASVPPVLFLWYSQWAMFGTPFLPGQFWMPDVTDMQLFGEFQNPYSTEGMRGFTWPAPDLYLLNLFDPSYGMFLYGPLLVLGLVPAVFYHRGELILPRPERIFSAVLFAALLTFCAANQYSRIQFNSGFRYLVPLVPIMFLAASDHLSRMPRKWLWVLAIPVLLNSWVIAMVREPVPASWREVLSNGIQFPWLAVLRETLPQGHPVGSTLVPLVILALVTATIVAIWKVKIPQSE